MQVRQTILKQSSFTQGRVKARWTITSVNKIILSNYGRKNKVGMKLAKKAMNCILREPESPVG
jgi:hypothetical protein